MSTPVIAPATNTRLTTVQAVREVLGYTEAAQPTSKIERLIDMASGDAVRVCNRVFARQTYREHFNAWDLGCGILLSESPVIRILSVTLGGATIDPSEIELDGMTLHRLTGGYRGGWFGRGMVVEYEAGWRLPGDPAGTPPAEQLPGSIEKAVIQLVAVAVSEASRDVTIKQSSVEGIGSRSYYVPSAAAQLPHPGAEAALMQFRKLVLV